MKIDMSKSAEEKLLTMSYFNQSRIKSALIKLRTLSKSKDLIEQSIEITGESSARLYNASTEDKLYKCRLCPGIRMVYTVGNSDDNEMILIVSFYTYGGD